MYALCEVKYYFCIIMQSSRQNAIETIGQRAPQNQHETPTKLSSIYAKNVFGYKLMKKHLSKEAYAQLKEAIAGDHKLDRATADEIADGMKNWAMSRGVTHYTHWFQPLRGGSTAEKHDSFFEPTGFGKGMEIFTGESLVQQEPDASSFPNGGIRNTFEARGYTAWDPSSPAFIIEKASGKTLCIPTVFVAYTGEALDYKVPLLKSVNAVKTASTKVAQLFDAKVKTCSISLGVEQEYFLIDEAMFNSRQDLLMTGRTLLGRAPAKGQQLDDHYFGSIPERIYDYMTDFEVEALRLGIPLKTRHNEVAPGQYECAPMFEDVNLAVDHNTMLMDIMHNVASRHGLKVLMHEKPFNGLNGSGKHNNWSVITDTGVNVLKPGKTPEQNLQFLTFFINTIKAVHAHEDLLRASIASVGNDHRLGANEAPPAIISVFIGTLLEKVLSDFETEKKPKRGRPSKQEVEKLSIVNLPEILLDNTDRNRTSPFAFTGNKFEFRAVGSSDNCSNPMIVLNTIVADQLEKFYKTVNQKLKGRRKKEDVIKEVLRSYMPDCNKVIFGGNGYGDEWVKEAKSRGLSNEKHGAEALKAHLTPKSKKLFEDNNIFTSAELEARMEVRYEDFVKHLQIEARVLGDMIHTQVVPAAIKYQETISRNLSQLAGAGLNAAALKPQKDLANSISIHLNKVIDLTNKMVEERKKANKIVDVQKRALAYTHKVKSCFDDIRYHSDKLEQVVADDYWPLPKYREMLFVK